MAMINKFDQEPLRLFSRIVADKKKYKFNSYGGGEMEGETCFSAVNAGRCGVSCSVFTSGECGEPQEISPKCLVEEHGVEEAISIMEYYGCFGGSAEELRGEQVEEFSEELKQIVRETKGVWPFGVASVSWSSTSAVQCWSHDKRWTQGQFYRPEYERCLAQMTGRPKVDRWNKNTKEITYNSNGEWLSYDYDRHEHVFYGSGERRDGLCMVMSKEEALEREAIMQSDTQKSAVKPGESMKEAYERNFGDMANGESISEMNPILITLNQIKETGNKSLLKNMLAHKNKSEADDDQFEMSDIIDSGSGLNGCMYAFRVLPEHSDIWKRFAWWCACQVSHLSDDDRVAKCLKVTIDYIDGKATKDQLAEARKDAAAAVAADYAAYAATTAAAAAAAYAAAADYAAYAATAAAYAATAAAYAATARKEIRECQEEKLKQILGSGKWVDDEIEQAEADIAGLAIDASGTVDIPMMGYANEVCDWFRNGDIPPIGEKVFAERLKKVGKGVDRKRMSVIGIYDGKVKKVWLTNKEGAFRTVGLDGVYPVGFSFNQMYLDAIEEDVIRDSKSDLAEAIRESVENTEFFDADELAEDLFNKGCRIPVIKQ